LQVLEVNVDDVLWKDEIVTVVPKIENGKLELPTGPGWGVEVNEEALELYPAVDDPRIGIWAASGDVGQGKAGHGETELEE